MAFEDTIFWALVSVMLQVLVASLWGWGILYSLSKIKKYKGMFLGFLGCTGMLLVTLVDLFQDFPITFFLWWSSFEQIVQFQGQLKEVQVTLENYYGLEAVFFLFQAFLVFGLSGKWKEGLVTTASLPTEDMSSPVVAAPSAPVKKQERATVKADEDFYDYRVIQEFQEVDSAEIDSVDSVDELESGVMATEDYPDHSEVAATQDFYDSALDSAIDSGIASAQDYPEDSAEYESVISEVGINSQELEEAESFVDSMDESVDVASAVHLDSSELDSAELDSIDELSGFTSAEESVGSISEFNDSQNSDDLEAAESIESHSGAFNQTDSLERVHAESLPVEENVDEKASGFDPFKEPSQDFMVAPDAFKDFDSSVLDSQEISQINSTVMGSVDSIGSIESIESLDSVVENKDQNEFTSTMLEAATPPAEEENYSQGLERELEEDPESAIQATMVNSDEMYAENLMDSRDGEVEATMINSAELPAEIQENVEKKKTNVIPAKSRSKKNKKQDEEEEGSLLRHLVPGNEKKSIKKFNLKKD